MGEALLLLSLLGDKAEQNQIRYQFSKGERKNNSNFRTIHGQPIVEAGQTVNRKEWLQQGHTHGFGNAYFTSSLFAKRVALSK